MCVLTFLGSAWDIKIAVEASVHPQLALCHRELLQVPVDGKGLGPVQPNNSQVTVHVEGRYVLRS